MASIWSLNGADFYVDGYSEEDSPIIAEIVPISSDKSSVYHYIATPNTRITLEGHVVGTSNVDTIKAAEGSNVTLISDLVPGGTTVLVENVQVNRLLVWRQTIDSTQSETAPVYRVSVGVIT